MNISHKKTKAKAGTTFRQLPSFVVTKKTRIKNAGGRCKQQKKETRVRKAARQHKRRTRPPPVHDPQRRTKTKTKNTSTADRTGKPHSSSHRAHRSPHRRHDRNSNAGHQNRPVTRLAERSLPQQPSRCLSRRGSPPGCSTPHRPFAPSKGENSVLRAPPAHFSITSSSSCGRWRRGVRGGSPASENSRKLSQGGDRRAPQVGYGRASNEGSLDGQDKLQGEVERGSSAQKKKEKKHQLIIDT